MKKLISFAIAFFFTIIMWGETYNLKLNLKKIGAPVQPTMYGLFFEDINYAADGGLYAEKIKNRSFEFPQNLMGWKIFGKVEVMDDGPFERNPHYVRLSSSGHNEKYTGLENEGFTGIGVVKGEKYRFSVWARVFKGNEAKIKIVLADKFTHSSTQEIASTDLLINSKDWKKYSVEIIPEKTVSSGVLRIFLSHPDTDSEVDLEHISLFPLDTWKGHENGLRKDLAQKLADINPGVFRFPGGCIVEGTDLDTRYRWKNTIGPVENRPINENRWHYTFTNHFFPDYYQSNGLGFYEYFLLSEEIGAEPLPVINVGLACQYQNDNPEAHVPVDSLREYIQDALDLIEFANGPVSSTWGALRAEMGHPKPFNLKLLAIGNEQWGPEYVERLEKFISPVRNAYPEIKIIGSSGPQSEGEQFEYLWPEMKRLQVDLVDEHFYRPEEWFLSQATRYDDYDRKGPKVFAGEYACHTRDGKANHFKAALMEAAFMTGLERNADIVHMATYAPLFAHVDAWQWRPDMIWFDNLKSVPTASYYVQQMYSTNKGTHVIPLNLNDGTPLAGLEGQNGLFASAVYDKNTDQILIKLVNTSAESQTINIDIEGLKKGQEIMGGEIISLSADLNAENSLENPEIVKPQKQELTFNGRDIELTVNPFMFTIYKLQLKS